jgi:Tol biopolymer transport system component
MKMTMLAGEGSIPTKRAKQLTSLCFFLITTAVFCGNPAAALLSERSDVAFDVSPKGDYIVFTANGEGGHDIYLLVLKTLQVKRVLRTPEHEYDPRFSPDGRQIVYAAAMKSKEAAHLFVCALDGTGRKQLTREKNVFDWQPSFSRDGSQIVFARAGRRRPYSMGGFTWDQWDFYKMTSDGKQIQRLTRGKYYQTYAPTFSPDGKSIVFGIQEENADIYRMLLNKKKALERLTRDGHNYYTTLAADSKELLFLSDQASPFNFDIYRMKPNGTGRARITDHKSYLVGPRAIADGKHIYFLSDPKRDSRYDLCRVDRDGKNLLRIADSRLFDAPLRWKPR